MICMSFAVTSRRCCDSSIHRGYRFQPEAFLFKCVSVGEPEDHECLKLKYNRKQAKTLCLGVPNLTICGRNTRDSRNPLNVEKLASNCNCKTRHAFNERVSYVIHARTRPISDVHSDHRSRNVPIRPRSLVFVDSAFSAQSLQRMALNPKIVYGTAW
ncbi:hypothetical protein CPB84DRAFT_1782801 [Gymnopilus junonius]|uniref:Uncharacterized protein n=1 Tax=Gymnopilus junonius TaxID=109634 RepID=A0A9P5NLS8_GYMJU|nr:hypothetical protein CPB84DRAFT_1782801 [Gymnopilus junonius]